MLNEVIYKVWNFEGELSYIKRDSEYMENVLGDYLEAGLAVETYPIHNDRWNILYDARDSLYGGWIADPDPAYYSLEEQFDAYPKLKLGYLLLMEKKIKSPFGTRREVELYKKYKTEKIVQEVKISIPDSEPSMLDNFTDFIGNEMRKRQEYRAMLLNGFTTEAEEGDK